MAHPAQACSLSRACPSQAGFCKLVLSSPPISSHTAAYGGKLSPAFAEDGQPADTMPTWRLQLWPGRLPASSTRGERIVLHRLQLLWALC